MASESTEFAEDIGFPKNYEHGFFNWFKFTFMLIIFYACIFPLSYAIFILGTGDDKMSTYWNYIVFLITFLVAVSMVKTGNKINRMKLQHEFYLEKIASKKL